MSKHHIEQELRDKGIQPTAQRVEVLYHLRSGCHHTADELFDLLNEEFSKVSRATVYNTLNLLKEQGLIGEVLVAPGKSIFDGNAQTHYHYYNVDTKELADIPSGQIRLTGLPSHLEGKVVLGADVIIRIGEPKGD